MSDYDEDDEEELSEIAQRWERVNDDFLLFDRVPESDRLFSSPDLCAWALLDKKFPAERQQDMVSAAEHDEIWLRIMPEQITQLTDNEILYLTRCGVRYDDDTETLCMYV
jgi:hypothetical protein